MSLKIFLNLWVTLVFSSIYGFWILSKAYLCIKWFHHVSFCSIIHVVDYIYTHFEILAFQASDSVGNSSISLWLPVVYILIDLTCDNVAENFAFLFIENCGNSCNYDFLNFPIALILAPWNINMLQSVSCSSIFWTHFIELVLSPWMFGRNHQESYFNL